MTNHKVLDIAPGDKGSIIRTTWQVPCTLRLTMIDCHQSSVERITAGCYLLYNEKCWGPSPILQQGALVQIYTRALPDKSKCIISYDELPVL